MALPQEVAGLLDRAAGLAGPIVVLTGAGISAESGIPTFRGPEGFWTVGSKNYRPEELATRQAFEAMPAEIWGWYLYRMRMCGDARPNRAHCALVELERAYGDRFLLVTQNVDGLHRQAGTSPERLYEIHGNIHFVRCSRECSPDPSPLPRDLAASFATDRPLRADELQRLTCRLCGALLRPHVLWFDECYDEERFRFESAQRAAARAALLFVVGTSLATTLPAAMVRIVVGRGAPLLVVDPDHGELARLAEESASGAFLQGKATEWVPEVVDHLVAARG